MGDGRQIIHSLACFIECLKFFLSTLFFMEDFTGKNVTHPFLLGFTVIFVSKPNHASMTSVQSQEDLEARIARIKKRNEEIEQKYREAEEDRLRAMKENAMVEIKPPKDDDWPREHKYDKIDFNYDLDPETLAQLEEKKKEKDAFIQKIAKDYKVFAEGEGPPPDPAYSFLADVERDGEKAAAAAAANNGNNGINGNNSTQLASPNGRSPPASKGGDHFDRRNPNNRSGHRQGPRDPGGPQQGGRPRVGSGKSSHHHGHHSHHHHGGPNIQRSFSTNEHDGWRSASGEQQRRNVTTPPIIGSGRVGPRQAAKPQFQFHTGPGEHNHHNQHNHHSGGGHQHSHGHGHHPLPLTVGGRKEMQQGSRDSTGTHSVDHFNRNVTGRKSDRGGESAKKHTGGGKGPFSGSSLQNGKGGSTAGGGAGSSVQDRLNRNRLVASSDRNENITKTRGDSSAQPVVSGAAKATLKTISKIIEKNAEIDVQLAREMARENEKLSSKVKELRLQQQQQQQQQQ